MLRNYRNEFVFYLIQKFGYQTIKNASSIPDVTTLFRFDPQLDADVILEIAEEPNMPLDILSQELNQSLHRVLAAKGNKAIYVYRIILCSHQPSEATVAVLRKFQLENKAAGRFFHSALIDTEGNQWYALYPGWIPAQSMELALQSFFSLKGKQFEGETDERFEEISAAVPQQPPLVYYASKPMLSYLCIGANILIYLVLELYAFLGKSGGVTYQQLLLLWGAKNNGLIMQGEWYRFIIPMFFHGNVMHLAVNCYSLYALSVVENLFGHKKFLWIYFLSGILGTAASFAFNIHDSVGASGAIFGLLGALFYFGIEKPELFARYFKQGLIMSLVINVAYGLSNPNIDNYAHFGGMIGGFLAAGIVMVEPRTAKRNYRFVAAIIAMAVFLGVFAYGLGSPQNKLYGQFEAMKKSYYEAQDFRKTLEISASMQGQKNLLDTWELRQLYELTASAHYYLKEADNMKPYCLELQKLDAFMGYYLLAKYYVAVGDRLSADKHLQLAAQNIGNSMANAAYNAAILKEFQEWLQGIDSDNVSP